jgi:hypothetical protein
MAQQEPDLKNQNQSPVNAGSGAGASAPTTATPAPAPSNAPVSEAPKKDAPANKPDAKPATTDPKKGPAGKDPKASKKAYREVPNETFIRRRKQKRVALVILSVSGIGVLMLGIIAFLGQVSGNFTVKIDSKADLTMDDTDGTFVQKTSYLKATGLKNASTIYADNIPDDDIVDGAAGGSKNGTKTTESHPDYSVDTYMCYTFYVKNVSKDSSNFNLTLNIDAYENGINASCSLIDIVRLRLYCNPFVEGETSTTHDNETYANLNKDGKSSELVSYENSAQERNRAAATPFLNNKTVLNEDYVLGSQDMYRYTVVMWLEGFDPDCKGSQPTQAYVTFSMFFSVL